VLFKRHFLLLLKALWRKGFYTSYLKKIMLDLPRFLKESNFTGM
jgi:hypothetical protein